MKIELCSKTTEILQSIANVYGVEPEFIIKKKMMEMLNWMVDENFHIKRSMDEDIDQAMIEEMDIEDIYSLYIQRMASNLHACSEPIITENLAA